MQVTFPDGSSTELQIHRTSAADPLVVLCLPAMGVRAKYYEKLAHTLTEHGCHAVLADHRGTRSDHFRWAAQPQALVRDAVKWIHTYTGPP